ncbi:hypothetical protein HHA02_06360 [Cobetia marina]|nr:hypothetical protein HHA02_06360 [Cobetia marina]
MAERALIVRLRATGGKASVKCRLGKYGIARKHDDGSRAAVVHVQDPHPQCHAHGAALTLPQ